jgi:hypothetical protein
LILAAVVGRQADTLDYGRKLEVGHSKPRRPSRGAAESRARSANRRWLDDVYL